MRSRLALHSDPAPMQGIVVSRNLRHFGLLVEDMEAELGAAWSDLTITEAISALRKDDAAAPDFMVLAVCSEDQAAQTSLTRLIKTARHREIRVILIADEIPKDMLQALLGAGANDLVPYPLAPGALHDMIGKSRAAGGAAMVADMGETPPDTQRRLSGQAAVFAVQALAGGTGASTLAANMAWEFATLDKTASQTVCLIDLDLQRATISAYLDLPRRDMMADLLQDARSMDVDGFRQALIGYRGRLSVLTAPTEILPLDIVEPADIQAILDLATQCFDIIVIDMPQTLVMWTEPVLTRADLYFVTLELDIRSAQNAIRFQQALRAEGLPAEKLNFVLNRAPGLTDLAGHARVRRLAETLGVNIATQLPDGGKPVRDACDNGAPLAEIAPKNPLRRDIRSLCARLQKAMLRDRALAS
jgi:pilus assembly protein CpaE